MSDDQRSELLNIMAVIAFCNQMSMDAFLLTVRLCDVFMTKTTQEMTKTKAKGTQIKGHENRTEDKPDRYSPSLESTFTKIWRTKLEKFTQMELYEMEFEILETLGYDTYAPRHENRTEDKPTLVLAKYYLETAMFSLELCQLKIEKIAAACLMAATMKLEEGRNYVESYATHTGYGFAELNELSTNSSLFQINQKRKKRAYGITTTHKDEVNMANEIGKI
ncbi:hypothetical protein niasHT_032144 [Heterodera trifolii]|uniref:Cyclin C-terminal domain-containing protein n=1 Tax=Heterodera trifolii TaxID=157864 RepID=A0ABD2HRT4_9BILA